MLISDEIPEDLPEDDYLDDVFEVQTYETRGPIAELLPEDDYLDDAFEVQTYETKGPILEYIPHQKPRNFTKEGAGEIDEDIALEAGVGDLGIDENIISNEAESSTKGAPEKIGEDIALEAGVGDLGIDENITSHKVGDRIKGSLEKIGEDIARKEGVGGVKKEEKADSRAGETRGKTLPEFYNTLKGAERVAAARAGERFLENDSGMSAKEALGKDSALRNFIKEQMQEFGKAATRSKQEMSNPHSAKIQKALNKVDLGDVAKGLQDVQQGDVVAGVSNLANVSQSSESGRG